ncbi:hypothetical protein IV79_GL000723 [Pediococcus claussenii]|nr:hypothetical protein IV79_GL000723 [Pediococcus claussenii]
MNKKRGFGRELLETSGILLIALLFVQLIGWAITKQSVLGFRRIVVAMVIYCLLTIVYRVFEIKLKR